MRSGKNPTNTNAMETAKRFQQISDSIDEPFLLQDNGVAFAVSK
jgi:hypothetical protein